MKKRSQKSQRAAKKAVKKSNATFKALTPAQTCAAIARDVLKQIKLQKFDIGTGNFASVRNDRRYEPDPDFFDKKYLNSPAVVSCDVCAIGACIISGIRLFNKASFQERHLGVDDSWDLVTRFFSPEQAVLIENAFELGSGYYNDSNWHNQSAELPEVDTGKAIEFGKKYDDETERAIAIFENIVKNNGVFRP